MTSVSFWQQSVELPSFPALDRDLDVDVAIIGGGIAGVSAAYLLEREGVETVLIERTRCGAVDTGHTSAHLTAVTDVRPSELLRIFGASRAEAVWDAGTAALNQIHQNIRAEEIECGFAWVPGYLHASLTSRKDESRELRRDAEAAADLGHNARFTAEVPIFLRPGVMVPNQARFHPLAYLGGLLRALERRGSLVFEGREVDSIRDGGDSFELGAGPHRVRSRFLLIATHVPLQGAARTFGAALFQTKLALYSTYVIHGTVPRGTVPEGLFWDTSDPYYYLRADRGRLRDHLIFGGLDHKTGKKRETHEQFEALEALLKLYVPAVRLDAWWSGQVVETHDGLPYIGEATERQFVGTGFAGNGMTFGTLTAMMACDAVTGRENPWREIFDPGRKRIRGAWSYIRENVDYPLHLITDRLKRGSGLAERDVAPGEGRVVHGREGRVAVYRNAEGELVKLSPVCTHMGCFVRWNAAEHTWDCPCHGSRYRPTGEVLAGPAERPLKTISAPERAPSPPERERHPPPSHV